MSLDSYHKEVLTLRNEIFKKYALLKYATSWAYHSRNSKKPEETEDMAFYLLHEKFESRLFFRMLLSWYETPQATALWYHFFNHMLFEGTLELAMEEASTTSSLVHVAVSSGIEGLHRALAFSKAAINMQDWCTGSTPMSLAALVGSEVPAASLGPLEAVKLLLENGAEVDLRSNDGDTPLHKVAMVDRAETARLLLEKGADVNSKTEDDGDTAISLAVLFGSIETFKLLLKYGGVDINSRNNRGKTALVHAAEERSWEMVRILLQEDGIDIHLKIGEGQTPVSWVAQHDEMKLLDILLGKDDVEIDLEDDDGSTPLLLAALYNHKDIVERLLEKGANVNKQDDWGRTALIVSVPNISSTSYEYDLAFQVMKVLLTQPNIDVNLKDMDGDSALSLAIRRGFLKLRSF
jgi:ankyrin repeat protein